MSNTNVKHVRGNFLSFDFLLIRRWIICVFETRLSFDYLLCPFLSALKKLVQTHIAA